MKVVLACSGEPDTSITLYAEGFIRRSALRLLTLGGTRISEGA